MSVHHQSTVVIADTDSVGAAIAALAPVIGFLTAESAASFTPVNTNRDWSTGCGKRVLDLVVAVPAVLLLAPLFLVIAFLISIDSSGPVVFRQRRTGACGKSFDILKFRTMRVMENGAEVQQASAGDCRTTRVGRLLRRYSLDELPQLINVINGDMSLVGPRPHATVHDAYYGARLVDYNRRFAVKPGMTGWAQVNGFRGPTPTLDVMAARIANDIWYVKNASFALDLEILLKTPLAIVNPRNAL